MAAPSIQPRLKAIKEKVRLHGDDTKHEQTDSWSNRDLIPLPPARRTWGEFVRPQGAVIGGRKPVDIKTNS